MKDLSTYLTGIVMVMPRQGFPCGERATGGTKCAPRSPKLSALRLYVLVSALAGALVAGGMSGSSLAASANEHTDDVPVFIDMLSLKSFTDLNGRPITIEGETGGSGRKTLSGTQEGGAPVEITIYSVAVHDGVSAEELAAFAKANQDEPIIEMNGEVIAARRSVAPSYAASVVVATTATTIAVAWSAPDLTDTYSLTVGADMQFGSEPSFVITKLTAGETYQFTLGSQGDNPQDSTVAPVSTTKSLTVTTLNEKDPEGKASRGTAERTVSPRVSSTEFMYKTFLPYEVIAHSPELGDHIAEQACMTLQFGPISPSRPHWYSFRGDNRGFVAPSGQVDYRTMMSARYDFTTETFTFTSDVGDTIVWDMDDDVEVDTRQATKGGMEADVVVDEADIGQFQFVHVANDPFCPSAGTMGAISYAVDVAVYDDGTVFIEGLQAAMPAHEGWVQSDDSETWKSVFANKATNLGCLVGFPLVPACVIEIDAQVNSDPCIENPQFVNNTLTDTWYIADFALRRNISYELFSEPYADLTIADARNYTTSYNNYSPTPRSLDGIEQAINLEFFAANESTSMCSFEPLRNLTSLTNLSLSTGALDSLSVLSNLDQLESLTVFDAPPSLDGLAGMTELKYLNAPGGRVNDVTALTGLTGLTYLGLFGANPPDWSPIETLSGLQYLDLEHTNVTQQEVDAIQTAIGPGVTIHTSL